MMTPDITCTRCGRPLTSPASVKARMGATCARRVRQAREVAATFKARQVEKALEVLDLHAIVLARRGRRVFRVVSSDGSRRYLTTVRACTCPAGAKGRPCYHRAAAVLLTA